MAVGFSGFIAVLNPEALKAINKATRCEYASGWLKGLASMTSAISCILLGIDVGMSIYNNVTNPNLSVSRKITDSVIDATFSIGSFFVAASVGAKFGALVGSVIPIPVVGSIIGAVAGAVVGFVVGLTTYYIQQSQWYEDFKADVNIFFTETIPSAWNYFWSFEWAR